MRLTEIETFRALMSSGSTRKAAALLGVTQPAVSQSLRRLEDAAGFPLFQRLRGRLHPTPEAAALLGEVERVFVGMASIEHRLKTLREFGLNRLQLASFPAFGLGFMPRALQRFSAASKLPPQVSLQILSSRDVRDRVLAGTVDFGLMADEVSMEGLEASTFARFAGVAAMKEDHPLARHKQVRPEQLAEVPFIALNPEDASRRRLEAELSRRGVELRVSVHTPYSATVCELALRGLGVGIVNPITALDYAARGLVIRKLTFDVSFTCVLAVPAGKVLSGTARTFLSHMRKQLADDELSMRDYLRSSG